MARGWLVDDFGENVESKGMTSSQISFGHLVRLEPRLGELLLEISREPMRPANSDFCANELWLRKYKSQLILLVGNVAPTLEPTLCSSDAYAIAYSTLYDAMPCCRRCGCAG